jgi:hypothetical protein
MPFWFIKISRRDPQKKKDPLCKVMKYWLSIKLDSVVLVRKRTIPTDCRYSFETEGSFLKALC